MFCRDCGSAQNMSVETTLLCKHKNKIDVENGHIIPKFTLLKLSHTIEELQTFRDRVLGKV